MKKNYLHFGSEISSFPSAGNISFIPLSTVARRAPSIHCGNAGRSQETEQQTAEGKLVVLNSNVSLNFLSYLISSIKEASHHQISLLHLRLYSPQFNDLTVTRGPTPTPGPVAVFN